MFFILVFDFDIYCYRFFVCEFDGIGNEVD